MRKQNIRVSDAIPQMPLSFEQTVEQTLKTVCTAQNKQIKQAKTPSEPSGRQSDKGTLLKKQKRMQIFAYSAAAVLLVCVLVLGGVMTQIAFRERKLPEIPMADVPTETDGITIVPNGTEPTPAIRHDGTLYLITGIVAVGEPDQSAIVGHVTSVVPLSECPTENGQANFGEVGAPYAMTKDGLFVLFGNEWRLFKAEEFNDPALIPTVTPAPYSVDESDALCVFTDGSTTYLPYENWIWSDQDDGLAADGMSFLFQIEEIKDKIPTTQTYANLTLKVRDDVKLESINIYDEALNTVALAADLSTVRTLDPGVYYISARVSLREEDRQMRSGYECIVRVVIGEASVLPTPIPSPNATESMPTSVPNGTVKPTPRPASGPNKLLIPAIMYGEDLYVMHSELRPDAPDAGAVEETVTSLTHITQWPQKSGQANFGEIGAAFYVTSDGLVVYYNGEWRLLLPQEPGDSSDAQAGQDPKVRAEEFPFWSYDEKNGYREAPREGVLFRCDFDGDGTKEEIKYEIKKSSVRISVLGQSVETEFDASHTYAEGADKAILIDLDPESPTLNLVLVYYSAERTCDSIELHMENGKLVQGNHIEYGRAFLDAERNALVIEEHTELFGTQEGMRTYSGDGMLPDSRWLTLTEGVTEQGLKTNRKALIEYGKLLHLARDLPCRIDGTASVIPAGSYVYVVRYHDSETMAEVRTEDGTVTGTIMVERMLTEDWFDFLIDGISQDQYFDNIFYAE